MSQNNVLVIMTDELSRDGVSCYGGVAQTPNIDRLAKHGTRFDNAYTPSPICVPARAAFQSGRYVYQNRCWSNAQPYCGNPPGWGHRMQHEGHETVSIGKLHYRSAKDNNGFTREIEPLHVLDGEGWVFGLLRRQDHTPYDAGTFANHIGHGEDAYSQYDTMVRDKAVQWLKTEGSARRDKPWALFVSFLRPHYPLICPKPYFDMYDPQRIPKPRYSGYKSEFRHPVLNALRSYFDYDDYIDETRKQIARASYFGLCSFVDKLIGDVLHALEGCAGAGNTTIIFVSDHGEMNGHHGLWTKMTMHEDSVGIPMILTGANAPVGVCRTPTSLIDIHQTVLQAVGLKQTAVDRSLPGQSLFKTASEPFDAARAVISEYHDGGSITGIMMIRQGKWKYIAYAGFAPQLFDLDCDPLEENDLGLSEEYRHIREHLHTRLCREFGDPETISATAFSDQAERIDALGGIGGIYSRENFDHTPIETDEDNLSPGPDSV